jgi:hypothetical protein
MKIEDFFKLNALLDRRSANVLGVKSKEYSANDDKLHNFKRSAALRGRTPEDVLAGMMLKHTTSIYDMIDSVDARRMNHFSIALWLEKVIDHINFLKLLFALIVERDEVSFADVAKACDDSCAGCVGTSLQHTCESDADAVAKANEVLQLLYEVIGLAETDANRERETAYRNAVKMVRAVFNIPEATRFSIEESGGIKETEYMPKSAPKSGVFQELENARRRERLLFKFI